MRDFLFSDIALIHGFSNIPDDPDMAIAAGTRLCEDLLEPIQDAFGRVAVRSAYRSPEVNGCGSEQMRAGKAGYNCASNEKNHAGHIWDVRDSTGFMGATACIVVPSVWDRFQRPGDWQKLAWWIHDTLPYSNLEFYPHYWAFNITWHERRHMAERSDRQAQLRALLALGSVIGGASQLSGVERSVRRSMIAALGRLARPAREPQRQARILRQRFEALRLQPTPDRSPRATDDVTEFVTNPSFQMSHSHNHIC